MTEYNLCEFLVSGAREMGIAVSEAQAAQFARFHEMLVETNKVMNLTRVPDDPREAVDRNYLDSLAPLAAGLPTGVRTLADVGAGAGFPGIPLAILLPEVHVVLIDALGKRVKFLQDVIEALGLNAEAVHARAEDAGRQPELRERFDVVTARAVAALNVLAELALPLVRVGGEMIAYKGPGAAQEASEAEKAIAMLGGQLLREQTVVIPGRDWDHRLLYIQKRVPTPKKYPRRPGEPGKNPLGQI